MLALLCPVTLCKKAAPCHQTRAESRDEPGVNLGPFADNDILFNLFWFTSSYKHKTDIPTSYIMAVFFFKLNFKLVYKVMGCVKYSPIFF